LEKTGNYYPAFNAYQAVLDKYPSYPKVNLILNRQFKIGNLFLQGKSLSFLKINPSGSAKRAIAIFQKVLANAPFSDLAPNAQYNLGVAYLQKKEYIEAAIEFEKVPVRYPQSEFVPAAKYQRAVCAYRQAVAAPYDQEASQEAINRLREYIDGYPNDKHVEHGKEMLTELQGRKAASLFQIGTYYERRENPKAALIYLREVVHDYPLTRYADKAKKIVAREEKRLELTEAVRQSQDAIIEIERLIGSQADAVGKIKAKGRTRWTFWRYVVPRTLSGQERLEVAERTQRIRALRDRLALAREELYEKQAVMTNRVRLLAAEAEIERVEDDLRGAQVELQVAQNRVAEIGEVPEGGGEILKSAAGEIAAREERARGLEAQLERLRSSITGLSGSVESEEGGLREYYRVRREALAARIQSREGAPPTGAAAGEQKDAAIAAAPALRCSIRSWFWPLGRERVVATVPAPRERELVYRDAVELMNNGEGLQLQKRWDEALDVYDRAALRLMELKEAGPDYRNGEIEGMLRRCRQGLEEARQASVQQEFLEITADLEERVKKNPLDAEACFSLAELCEEYGDGARAVELFRQVTELQPDNAGALYRLGAACFAAGDMKAAAEHLERAVTLAPSSPVAHHRLGLAQGELGDYDAARRQFEEAIKADPSFAPAYFSLGKLCQSALGDRAAAAGYWKRYLELAPDDPQAEKIREWLTTATTVISH
ncbi:MAG: outer membrane protein assembly factor BamD, partial [Candidatus Aureabacteria bacterium]|nr:outer membrane protein assembly factor BamD [Candidatus Auribacterota bacterium]